MSDKEFLIDQLDNVLIPQTEAQLGMIEGVEFKQRGTRLSDDQISRISTVGLERRYKNDLKRLNSLNEIKDKLSSDAELTDKEKEFIDVELVTIKKFKEILKKGLGTDIGAAYQALDYLKLL